MTRAQEFNDAMVAALPDIESHAHGQGRFHLTVRLAELRSKIDQTNQAFNQAKAQIGNNLSIAGNAEEKIKQVWPGLYKAWDLQPLIDQLSHDFMEILQYIERES